MAARIFLPAIVTGLWALVWWAGARDERLIGVFLTLMALAFFLAAWDRRVLRRRR